MKKVLLYIILFVLMSCTETTPVFDIPRLKGKNIKEVNRIIGNPYRVENPFNEKNWKGNRVPYHCGYYRKDGIEMMISFDPYTLEVISFLVRTSFSYRKIEDLMKLVNIDSISRADFGIESDTDEIKLSLHPYDNITIYPIVDKVR